MAAHSNGVLKLALLAGFALLVGMHLPSPWRSTWPAVAPAEPWTQAMSGGGMDASGCQCDGGSAAEDCCHHKKHGHHDDDDKKHKKDKDLVAVDVYGEVRVCLSVCLPACLPVCFLALLIRLLKKCFSWPFLSTPASWGWQAGC